MNTKWMVAAVAAVAVILSGIAVLSDVSDAATPIELGDHKVLEGQNASFDVVFNESVYQEADYKVTMSVGKNNEQSDTGFSPTYTYVVSWLKTGDVVSASIVSDDKKTLPDSIFDVTRIGTGEYKFGINTAKSVDENVAIMVQVQIMDGGNSILYLTPIFYTVGIKVFTPTVVNDLAATIEGTYTVGTRSTGKVSFEFNNTKYVIAENDRIYAIRLPPGLSILQNGDIVGVPTTAVSEQPVMFVLYRASDGTEHSGTAKIDVSEKVLSPTNLSITLKKSDGTVINKSGDSYITETSNDELTMSVTKTVGSESKTFNGEVYVINSSGVREKLTANNSNYSVPVDGVGMYTITLYDGDIVQEFMLFVFDDTSGVASAAIVIGSS